MSIIREIALETLLGPLNEIERRHAPERLFVAGDVSLLRSGPRVSVIGSRNADSAAVSQTRSLVATLVDRGMTVVGGLAEGVDTAAHETALTKGGRTIAVLGTPLDQFFPAKNRALQSRLMETELVVSQFPLDSVVRRENFPIRNRTMALLGDATFIVAATEDSGTVYQAWEALRLGRLLFLSEAVAIDSALSWPSKLIHYGAQILSPDNFDIVLDEMPEVSRDELSLL